MLLHNFLISILPVLLEDRLKLDSDLTQNVSLALLAGSAVVSFIVSPFIGRHADRFATRSWLLVSLSGELVGSIVIASAGSCMLIPTVKHP